MSKNNNNNNKKTYVYTYETLQNSKNPVSAKHAFMAPWTMVSRDYHGIIRPQGLHEME